MGHNLYLPNDIEEPFLRAAEGDIDAAHDLILDVLEENAPDVEGDDG